MALQALTVYAANEDISTVDNKSTIIGVPVAITDLSIIGDDNDVVTVTLQAQHGTFSVNEDLATVTGADSDAITINGARGDINNTLATLTYTPTSIGVDTIEVNLGSNVTGVIIDPIGGHAYKIIDDSLTWNQARVAAKQLVYGGVQGYLANITSDSEDQFIVEHLTGNGWIGASDQDEEGDWKWVDGPEAGTSFWSGPGAINGGQPVDGAYNHWNYIEPNNSSNEDCAEYIVGQGWNDLNCDGQQRNYVVEFGAAEVPDPVLKQFTITSTGATRNIADCSQLMALTSSNRFDTINLTADIDCQNVEAHPLVGGETFEGTLNGNGRTIRNVTIGNYDAYNQALFSSARNAIFKDVTLDRFTVSSYGQLAALVAYVEGSLSIDNVHVTNVTLGTLGNNTGGLVGSFNLNAESHITNSSVDGGAIECAADSSDCQYLGGLVGYAYTYDNASLVIEKSYTNITINAPTTEDVNINYTGGLIGYADIEQWDGAETTSMTLQDVYSWTTINANNSYHIGGLVGYVYGWSGNQSHPVTFTIQRAYASGAITGSNYVGGLIGTLGDENTSAFILQNVFAMGKVTATDPEASQGAIIGHSNAEAGDVLTANSIYYDQIRTTQETAGVVDGLDAVTTVANSDNDQSDYFVNNSTNAPMNTWDFNTIWVKNSTVPPTFKVIAAVSDNDGISAAVEDAGPNNGDANGDNIKDKLQNNVASFPNPITGDYVVLALDNTCSITNISVTAEDSNFQDEKYSYASGFVRFTADCTDEQTMARVYQFGVSANNMIVRKYDSINHSYFTIDSSNGGNDYSLATQTIGGQTAAVASYTIVDDGNLDLDKNPGHILDPVGLGIFANNSNLDTPNTGALQKQPFLVISAGVLSVVIVGITILYILKRLRSSS